MDPRDRRKHPRLEGQFTVDLLNMGDDPSVSPYEAVIPAEALDVSRKGMRLKVTYTVPAGSYLSVILYYQRHESVCLCKVMWRREMMGEQLYGLYIEEWSKLDVALDRQLRVMEIEEEKEKQPQSYPAQITPA